MAAVSNIKVSLAGCGVVGSGVLEIIRNRRDYIAERTGFRFEVAKILVSSLAKPRGMDLAESLFTDDPRQFSDTEADLVVEVLGGTSVAKEIVLASLKAGRPVVTANKALLAEHGAEIYGAARAAGTYVAFEASCAGGLPIVGALLGGLMANRVDRLTGILNGTCNFILTEMLDKGKPYGDALSDAQAAGYAEADPSLDVGGGDTAHKLTILGSLAFGMDLECEQVCTTGIEAITLADLAAASAVGYACKLLGVAERLGENVSLQVHPTLIPLTHPLARVGGSTNAVSVFGDAVGETFYAGAGAGSLPTASAVVADMISVATGSARGTFGLPVFNDLTSRPACIDPNKLRRRHFIRLDGSSAGVDLNELHAVWRETGPTVESTQLLPKYQCLVSITEETEAHSLKDEINGFLRHCENIHATILPIL